MGERVVVDPSAAAAAGQTVPPLPPRGARPRGSVPLNYGHADGRFESVWRFTAGFREGADGVLQRLGGTRRVLFALGLAFVLAGFAYAVASSPCADEAAFFAGLGGVLLGLTVPVK